MFRLLPNVSSIFAVSLATGEKGPILFLVFADIISIYPFAHRRFKGDVNHEIGATSQN